MKSFAVYIFVSFLSFIIINHSVHSQQSNKAAPVADFSADYTTNSVGRMISLTDESTNSPTVWKWSVIPHAVTYVDGTSNSSQNPKIIFTAKGEFTVKLIVSNHDGSDTETKANYFTISDDAISSFPYLQDFDSWTISSPGTSCTPDGSVDLEENWQNVIGDNFDWDIYTGNTASSNTGPSGDHTSGSGNYLYTESSGTCSNKTASIISPTFDFSSLTNPEMNFWYSMYGNDMGTMSVQVSVDGGLVWSSNLWSLSGNQYAGWNKATISLSSYAAEENVIIRITGLTGSGYRSDMAIDDFKIYDCSIAISSFPYLETFDTWTTSTPAFGCTSDGSVDLEDCWENVTGDDIDWDIYTGNTGSGSTGPDGDHTSGSGNYLYTEASSCYYSTGYITTPYFDLSGTTSPVMSFWYSMYGNQMGSLSVQVSTNGGTSWSSNLWSLSGNQGSGWNEATISLSLYSSETNLLIRFRGVTGNNYRSDMAIDDFQIADGPSCTYCESEGNMDYLTSVTGVIFSTVDKSSAKPSGYSDYTSEIAYVSPSSSYDLSVRVNTDGNYRVYARVWIDWNQDCDFDDIGESYDLGSARNVSDGLTNDSPYNVTVPSGATIGTTVMRVSAEYNQYPTSCETDFDGEVEDYTIEVTQNYLWNGSVSNDWSSTANWSSGSVPGSSTDVIIPGGLARYPIVDETGSCNNVFIYDGGSITLTTGANITVNGDMEVSGDFVMNTGACAVSGDLNVASSSLVDINGGTLSMNGWYEDGDFSWARGVVKLSGGTITVTNDVALYDATGSSEMNGPFRLNVGGDIQLESESFSDISGGTIVMTGSGYILPTSSTGTFKAYNLYIDNSGGEYKLSREDYFNYDTIVNELQVLDGFLNFVNGTGMPQDFYVGDSVEVYTGGSVTAFVNDVITINGNITIFYKGGSKGSWIDNDKLSVNGQSYVESEYADDRWHFISSPVDNGKTGIFLNMYLKWWDEPNNEWHFIPETYLPLVPGIGYTLWDTLGTDERRYTGGTLNSGSVSPTLTATNRNFNSTIDNDEGYNLIGNPYPSAIDWGTDNDPVAEYVRTNIDNSIYVWTGTQYATFNPSGNGGNGIGTNGGSRYIGSMQGFFIKANDLSPAITIPNAARVHNTSPNLKYDASDPMLRFSFMGNNYSDELVISANPNAKTGFDHDYDAFKLFGEEYAPQIYSINGGDNLAINTLPDIHLNLVVPLGIKVGAPGDYKIILTELENLNSELIVYLENRLTKKYTRMDKGTVYDFTAVSTAASHMFNVHFKNEDFDVDAANLNEISIFSFENTVFVRSPSNIEIISVYNTLGQLVHQELPDNPNSTNFDLNINSGIYIIRVNSTDESASEKVFIP
jgi:hypothetical protein